MLSRMLFVRLKAAEHALRDGRLDEAYRLATAPDLRSHRRGGAVLAALTERFLERARHHFRGDRFTAALIDLDRAEAGGVMKEEIAELREHVRTVSAEQQRREQSRRGRIESARRRIEGGSLAAGRRRLEHASTSDLDANKLRREVSERVAEVEQNVEQAERLIARGFTAAAVQRLMRAKAIDVHHEAVTRAETRLCSQVLEHARAAFVEGRLSRASDELGCLGELGQTLPARRELADMLGKAREASRCLAVKQYAEARRCVMMLSRLLPEAEWIRANVEQLKQMDDLRAALLSGPLGDRMGRFTTEVPSPAEAEGVQRAADFNPRGGVSTGRRPREDRDVAADAHRGSPAAETVALPTPARAGGPLPNRLLLLVDGGGSYLILRSDRVTLGRAATGDPADIPVFSDVAKRHASLARVDEDYFLVTDKEVALNGRPVAHQLLQDGDRIVLGRKAKLTFRVPSRKSPTAVLDLSDTTKMPNDVRRIILFHRHASVGSGPSAHVRCQHAGPSLVLYERDGAWWIRQRSDGHVDTEACRLRLGEPIEIAGASLVLKPWEVLAPGGRNV